MTDVSRDERHDSTDPATGVLTAEAQARRVTIMARLRSMGHDVGSWFDAVRHPAFEAAVADPSPEAPEPAEPA